MQRFQAALGCALLGLVLSGVAETHWRFWLNLCWLLANYGEVQERTLGRTQFAEEAAYYQDVHISKRHRLEYLRDGCTIIRGALPPKTLMALREVLVKDFGAFNTLWSHLRAFDSDSLMDFVLYSNLGALAAELFQMPNTETVAEEPSAFYWRDFLWFRMPGHHLSPLHTDTEDCDREGLPPNLTRRNRPRVVVALDDLVLAPIVLNVSMTLEAVQETAPETDPERFWHGELDLSAKFGALTEVAPDREHDLIRLLALPQTSLRLGDILLHPACTLHMSPEPTNQAPRAVLFLTYCTGSSRPKPVDGGLRLCNSARRTVEEDPTCFPRAYPPPARPTPGTHLQMKHEGSRLRWLLRSVLDSNFGRISSTVRGA